MENLEQRGNERSVTADVVAWNVRRLRKATPMDLKKMSGKLREIGRPISVPALSKLENGGRRVDVDDLVALAIVLRVNPNALLFQPTLHPGHRLSVTGKESRTDAEALWAWARGLNPLTPFDSSLPAPDEDVRARRTPAARKAEYEKFRARVSPGAPEYPGPGSAMKVATKSGGRTVYTDVPIPDPQEASNAKES